jgi:hypothetical protein
MHKKVSNEHVIWAKHNMMHIVSWIWLNITFGKDIFIFNNFEFAHYAI